jgi:hypothetical protein
VEYFSAAFSFHISSNFQIGTIECGGTAAFFNNEITEALAAIAETPTKSPKLD